MSPRSVTPPWEYLCRASLPALQSFELSRLNHAANLKKEIDALLDQWLDETVAALLARFLMRNPGESGPATRGRSRRVIVSGDPDPETRLLVRTRTK